MSYSYLTGKRILITGGTGTFGRALVSHLTTIPEVEKIAVFSRDEFKQSEMQQEFNDPRLRFFLGDVRDLPRLERAFQDVDIVVHAAALKQVPALEYNPLEAVKTNVIGTQNVIDAALNNNVDKVFFISSDKAVHPINLYGATKLCAEKLCVAANAYRGANKRTKFSVARYGNVLGSRGSMVELIQKQRSNGVITLTDDRMTRFWIRIDKVMGVILGAIEIMQGGEIFVPKMKSLRVADMIKTIAPECKVATIGIRPGEKLHEVLITEHEVPRTRDAGKMFVIAPEGKSYDTVWLNQFPRLSEEFMYASNNETLLMMPGEAEELIG